MSETDKNTVRPRRNLLPYLLLAPGIAWLLIFFLIPLLSQAYVSLQSGDPELGFSFTWNFSTYATAVGDYSEQFIRSVEYAGVATVLALIISFPLAYFIAYKAGRFKNVMLLLVVLPFFTSYLMRTVAWQTILSDNGFVVDTLKQVGILEDDGRLLATSTAVIAGITYNFLPFMVLPLYASLERIDRRLIEAATDLYANHFTAFRKVTIPLAVPGIFAGALLTFIPAVGDFINAQLLGTPQQYMIGNTIQANYLKLQDYPLASAQSFVLLGFTLVTVAVYARLLGKKNLMDAAI